MKAQIQNGIRLCGAVALPPSKSEAIRAALLLALSGRDPDEALAGYEGFPVCYDTASALAACKSLVRGPGGVNVGASAALLRMLLPVCLALYGEADIIMDERLAARGLEEFEQALGVELNPNGGALKVKKRLLPGEYKIDCTRSSQFLSGLIIALPLLEGESVITPVGVPVSKSYADMTIAYASLFGARLGAGFVTEGGSIPVRPSKYSCPRPPYLKNGVGAFASGDCSYAAFFHAANILGGHVEISGVDPRTLQPDIAFPIVAGHKVIDVSAMPDLLPPLAAVACRMPQTTVLRGTARLSYKESSRAEAMAKLINALGGSAAAGEDELIIQGGAQLSGGECSACGDHRLAMTAAILAGVCASPVLLEDADSVAKSAPGFWEDYKKLGGEYEFIRE